jgi:hypothetical protein
MKAWQKLFMAAWGTLVGALIVAQLAMGRVILAGATAQVKKMHEHTGYLTTALALLYVTCSVVVMLHLPDRPQRK